MLIQSLPLKNEVKRLIIENDKIIELYPPQEQAIEKGLLAGKNLVISIPTAAGKTLLAELSALKHITENDGKVIYLCPLRALASEKYKEFQRFKQLGVRTTITSGDFDSTDEYLPRFDIIVSTNEKMDALLRHQASWIAESVTLVIIDECHLLNDQHRGPTLETLLARLLIENSKAQIVALSATIGNAIEIADWLGAELVKSEWRPVPLKEGVYFKNEIIFDDFSTLPVQYHHNDPLVNIALDSVYSDEQMLIFTPSRRLAVSTAEKIGKGVKPRLESQDQQYLNELSKSISTNLTDPLTRKLSETIKNGVTFHHAGLNSEQRELVELAFKKGAIKVLCATPTLCVAKNTKIWHGLSETSIEDLSLNQTVYVLTGNKLNPLKLQEIINNGNTNHLIEFSTVSGYKITVTSNHRILIKRGQEKLVLPAYTINKQDKIATIGIIKNRREKQCFLKDFIRENELPIKNLKINGDLSYFIGLMLGDGYSGGETKSDSSLTYKGSPSIVNNDEEILVQCEKICRILNIATRKRKNVYGTSELILGKNKWFRELLVRCGVEKGDRKFISKELLEMESKNISCLLKGLFDSDGYINQDRVIGFSNTSKRLVKQTQKLLLVFGIVCRLRKRKKSVIEFNHKIYKTKSYYELLISQKKSILRFYESIGFNLERKQTGLTSLVTQIKSNIYYLSCSNCQFKLYKDLFTGRTESQKDWGQKKLAVITLLGERGELGSRKIKELLQFEPKKDERRLNHHYELIKKRKIGKISKNEWFWSLNSIGLWIYEELIKNGNKTYDDVFSLIECPICRKKLYYNVKKGWRDSDFDGDIFWDNIRFIKPLNQLTTVYDLVLPDDPANDHMFVANGIIVHNSAGVNLPAKRVVISSVYRYSVEEGSHPIKTLEYKQMVGRAGRPQFDKQGESILLAKQQNAVSWLMERYINNEPEAVYSKLAAKPALRRCILGLISSEVVSTVYELLEFFDKTFYGYQFEAIFLENKIREVLDLFIGWGMIHPLDANERLIATSYGKRVSQLYLDPETAAAILEGLEKGVSLSKPKIYPVGLLDLIAGTPDMVSINFRKSDWTNTEKRFQKLSKKLIRDVPNNLDIEYEFRLRDFRTVLFLWDWIKELPLEKIVTRYKIGSGDIRRIVETATWLISAMSEISELQSRTNNKFKLYSKTASVLSERVEYGIKSDAISLTHIRGIGRKRARILLKYGIRDISNLVSLKESDLQKIPGFGEELARNILLEAKEIKKSPVSLPREFTDLLY